MPAFLTQLFWQSRRRRGNLHCFVPRDRNMSPCFGCTRHVGLLGSLEERPLERFDEQNYSFRCFDYLRLLGVTDPILLDPHRSHLVTHLNVIRLPLVSLSLEPDLLLVLNFLLRGRKVKRIFAHYHFF